MGGKCGLITLLLKKWNPAPVWGEHNQPSLSGVCARAHASNDNGSFQEMMNLHCCISHQLLLQMTIFLWLGDGVVGVGMLCSLKFKTHFTAPG